LQKTSLKKDATNDYILLNSKHLCAHGRVVLWDVQDKCV